jgi:hypothetical protein
MLALLGLVRVWLAAGYANLAKRLAYGGIWWVLSSRRRFLDDGTVGDSWATDGMTFR